MAQDDTTPQASAKPKESRRFIGGAVVLVFCILMCGVFAGLAGKKVGSEHVDFGIAFAFLGLVTIGIFALAWVDASSRGPDEGDPLH